MPPKIKDCIWRVCRDVLPNKVNLFNKNIGTDKCCVFCVQDLETAWHLFFNCQFALECWGHAGLRAMIEDHILHGNSLREVVLSILGQSDHEAAAKFSTIL